MTNQISERHKASTGFSLIETAVVLVIAMITAAFALPIVQTTVNKYQLKSATSTATWAIQSTRFQSLMQGYSYQVTFSGGTGGLNPTYQIAKQADWQQHVFKFRHRRSAFRQAGRPWRDDRLSVPAEWNGDDVAGEFRALHVHDHLFRHDRNDQGIQLWEHRCHPVGRPRRGALP